MVYKKRELWYYNSGDEVFTFATEAEANAKANLPSEALTEKELDEAFAPEEEWDEEE